MRSYFVECIATEELARAGIHAAFPEQESVADKVFFASNGDPISWLYTYAPTGADGLVGPFIVQADVTGRYPPNEVDELVISALRRVQAIAGGVIRDDDDNEV